MYDSVSKILETTNHSIMTKKKKRSQLPRDRGRGRMD